MSTTTTLLPVCKMCRREGSKLFLKGDRCNTTKCAIVKRKYPPGVHGIKRQSRLSDYGMQLRAKQKAKRLYGIMERQFMNYYEESVLQGEEAELTLKRILELRLDNVIYRLGFSTSRSQARQMVGHGKFCINGKKLDIPSYRLKIGDTITIKESKKNSKLFVGLKEKLQRHELPSWLTFNNETLEGKVVSLPTIDDVAQTIEAKQIIEFYSRF